MTGSSESPTKVAVSVRDFSFVVDEPANFGGTDAGPNPVEYSLASLAGCVNVVISPPSHERGVELRALPERIAGGCDTPISTED